MLRWLKEKYHCEIVCLTIDLGQTADNLEEIKQKAIRLGAKEAIVVDAKDEFADDVLSEAIMANSDYQGGYALCTPLGRVLISKIAVRMCEKYNCQVVAHGCTGKGNDQVRFESYITTLNPRLKTLAPVREWGMGRTEEIEYAEKHGIPVKQKKDIPYSYDENMWGNTGEGGEIENPELIPPLEKIMQWCVTPQKAPDVETIVTIEFEKGKPVALNGRKERLSKIIMDLNKVGAANGCGVFHVIEDRVVGLKVRGVYENPGAAILTTAHRAIERLVSTREENELKTFMDTKWAYLCYGAKWFDPVMHHIKAFMSSQNQKVTGEVKVRLYKGNIEPVAAKSRHSLFDHSLATFECDAKFNQNASAGFIELWNLAQKTAYNVFDYEKTRVSMSK